MTPSASQGGLDLEVFEGFPERECGEHRTTGQRAWCFEDQEWCYPKLPCRGCEMPQLRARLASLLRVREAAVAYYSRPQSREFEEALRAGLADSEEETQ